MKIASISAFPDSLNPGMLSCDLALSKILEKIPAIKMHTRFNIEEKISLPIQNKTFDYEYLEDPEQLENFDCIIYWGDFLQLIDYAKQDYLSREKQRNKYINSDNSLDKWYKCILLENSPNLQKRSLIFGSTIYNINSNKMQDRKYEKALQTILSNSPLVLFRDIFSANIYSQLTNKTTNSFGCDCSFFLEPKKVNSKKNYLLYSFSRTAGIEISENFTKTLSNKLNIECIQFNWFSKDGFSGLEEKIDHIRNAKYLITDIYHLALTGLREGIPTLCIGRAAPYNKGTTYDKKKEFFFRQFQAQQYYIFLEYLESFLTTTEEMNVFIDVCIKHLNDRNSFNEICTLVNLKKNESIEILTNTIMNHEAFIY